MRLDPHPPPAFLFYQGLVEFAQGRLAVAAAAFETATDLDPGDPLAVVVSGGARRQWEIAGG